MVTESQAASQIPESEQDISTKGHATNNGNEREQFLDLAEIVPGSLSEQENVCLRICNIVTEFGAYRLTLPVKTWQANVAILSALERMKEKIDGSKNRT